MAWTDELKKEFQALDASPKKVRSFAWLFLTLFLGLIPAIYIPNYGLEAYTKSAWFIASIFGTTIGVLSLLGPRVFAGVYRAWMGLALVLGLISSTLVITLIFYLIMTPIALLMRASKGDFIGQNIDKTKKTYWEAHEEPEKNRYYKNF